MEAENVFELLFKLCGLRKKKWIKALLDILQLPIGLRLLNTCEARYIKPFAKSASSKTHNNNTISLCPGSASGDVRRLLADGLGTEDGHHRHDDQAGGENQGECRVREGNRKPG